MPTQDRIDTYEMPDGTQVPIRDSRVDNLAAEDVSYDNTESGLEATEVQSAIDELNSEIDNISVDADQVDYDNSTSGLNATDVQQAIDELANNTGSSSLEDLTDTNIVSVLDGQVIVWDSVSNKWVNVTLGDGTSAFTKTVLYNNTGTSESVIQLSESMQNFDLIEIVTNYPYSDSNVYCQNAIYTSAELINSIGQTNPVNWHIGNDSIYTWVIVTDVDEFTVHTVTPGLTIVVRQVYGYKFNGGSTSADNVSYDNTDSGLAATEVQSALDELTSDIKSTDAASALFHLGFYLDEHGGLCQVNSI